MSGKLTPRQAAFLALYLKNGCNAADAYRGAYNSKATAKNASKEGRKLLAHPLIAPEIERAEARKQQEIAKVVDDYAITPARIREELATIGFANMADYMRADADGTPRLDFGALTRRQAGALREVTVDEFVAKTGDVDGEGRPEYAPARKIKFRLHDKRSALVDLGRDCGMFKDSAGQPPNLDALRSEVYQAILGGLADRARSMHPVIEDASYQEIPKANGKGNGGSKP